MFGRFCLCEVSFGLLDNRLCQAWIFFKELHNAVSQLWMVHRQTLHLVQRQQRFEQECFVFFLQRQCKPVDDRPKNFEQLGNAIVMLGLVDEAGMKKRISVSFSGNCGGKLTDRKHYLFAF